MAVNSKDRDYMHRIGRYKAESTAQRQEAFDALSVEERLQQSMELYLRFRHSATLGARVDDPSPFYDRARRLGLYRP